MFIIYIISFVRKDLKEKEWFKSLSILLVYAVASSIVIIPIADTVHFAIGSLITIIAFIDLVYYVFSYTTRNKVKLKNTLKIFIKASSIILFFTYICNSCILIIEFNKNSARRTDIKHLENTIIEEYLYQRINLIDKFIEETEAEGKEVYILDFTSSIYNIPLDKYRKNYDMFNLGNFGKQGENGIIQNIEEKNNVVFLIQKKELAQNWQHPKQVTDYVINNYKKIGEIDIYDIFEK